MNELKKYESYRTFTQKTFENDDNNFDRYVGFFIDKERDQKGFIVCIDTDEIDLEEFKRVTNCDITVKQKVSLTFDKVIDIFEYKIRDIKKINRNIKKLFKDFDEDKINEYNDYFDLEN